MFFSSLCPVIMKTTNSATMLRHGCSRVLNTFPRHNRVPEPISNLWFTCQKHRPIFQNKNIKIYFRIFIGILKPVQNQVATLKFHTWPILFKIKVLPQINFPLFFKTTNKYFKTPNFFRRGATTILLFLSKKLRIRTYLL